MDAPFTVSESKAFRAELDALRKPLLAVLVNHAHPDHVNGIGALVDGKDALLARGKRKAPPVVGAVRDWRDTTLVLGDMRTTQVLAAIAATRSACGPFGTSVTTTSPTLRSLTLDPVSRTVPAHW